MGNPYGLELWEEFAKQVATQLHFAVGQIEVMAQLPGELVPAPRTEHQAVVGGALAVGDLAAALTERLALAEADLIPSAVRQRLGGDDQTLHRQLVTAQRWQGVGIALHSRHHPGGAYAGLVSAQAAGLPMGDGAVFIEGDPHAFDHPRQAAH